LWSSVVFSTRSPIANFDIARSCHGILRGDYPLKLVNGS
jgi:hypothetical protein